MKTRLKFWPILVPVLGLLACQLPAVLAGLGPATPTPDAYMTAAVGAQTRSAMEYETSVAQFFTPSPSPPPSSTSGPQGLATVPASTPTIPIAPSLSTATSAPPPSSISPTLIPSSAPNTPTAGMPPAGLSQTASVMNLHTQKCLQAASGSNPSTASILQAPCNGSNNQLWDLVAVGNGYYELVSRGSGRCLDVEGKHAAQNYDLVQWPCDSSPSQHWRFDLAGSYNQVMSRSTAAGHAAPPIDTGDYYRLIAQHSSMCADLDGWSHDDGAHIIQYPCASSDNDNQLWALR